MLDVGAADRVRALLVELGPVEAADVVRLEDLRVEHGPIVGDVDRASRRPSWRPLPILQGWNESSRRFSSSTSSARPSSWRAPIPRSCARGWKGSSSRSRIASRPTAASSRIRGRRRDGRVRRPVAHEDDAERAVRAALAIVDGVESLGSRCGSGSSPARSCRTRKRRRSRRASPSTRRHGCSRRPEPGEILLGPNVERMIRGSVMTEPLGVRRLAAFPTASRPGASSPSRTTWGEDDHHVPFIGREEELELLHNTLARAVRDRRVHLVTVYGAAGVGKSRLAREFIDGVERSTILTGRSLPYGEGVTYWPIAEMVKAAAGSPTTTRWMRPPRSSVAAVATRRWRTCSRSRRACSTRSAANGRRPRSRGRRSRGRLSSPTCSRSCSSSPTSTGRRSRCST